MDNTLRNTIGSSKLGAQIYAAIDATLETPLYGVGQGVGTIIDIVVPAQTQEDAREYFVSCYPTENKQFVFSTSAGLFAGQVIGSGVRVVKLAEEMFAAQKIAKSRIGGAITGSEVGTSSGVRVGESSSVTTQMQQKVEKVTGVTKPSLTKKEYSWKLDQAELVDNTVRTIS